MLDAERRQQIVAYVEERTGATVGELSEKFGVSEATARRDLVLLTRQGLVERAHGGAVPRRARAQRGFPEPPILVRAGLNAAEKRRIGEVAARFIEDGDTIIVNGGTTTEHLVPFLGDRQRLTVITNVLNVATLLAAHPHVTVVMLGGVLHHASFSLVGLLAEDALANLRADKLFAGIPAIHPDYGLSSDDMTEVQMDRAMLAAAREVTILADHSKFGNLATVRLAPMSRVKRVVTDGKTPAAYLDALREQGVLVEVA